MEFYNRIKILLNNKLLLSTKQTNDIVLTVLY